MTNDPKFQKIEQHRAQTHRKRLAVLTMSHDVLQLMNCLRKLPASQLRDPEKITSGNQSNVMLRSGTGSEKPSV
ncbi:unnamed protein product [Urochloa humidicola]